jgi:hypothetical protein
MRVAGSFLLAAALVTVSSDIERLNAFDIQAGHRISVEKPVDGDLLVAAREVRIRAPMSGDVAVAGSDVAIEQPVAGYVMAAGMYVDINGSVRDDLWAAGASVEVNGAIDDNAMLAGREVILGSAAVVHGGARIAADSVNVQAPVKRNLYIAARTAQIDSEIGGAVNAHVQRLRIMPGAVIRGNLTVNGPYAPEVSPQAKVLGQVHFNEVAARSEWSWLWWWLFTLAALLILGFAVLALAPAWLQEVADTISHRRGASVIAGLLGLLLIPVIAGFLLITIVGIPLGIIIFALYVTAVVLSGVFVAYFVGDYLIDRTGRRDASPSVRMAVGILAVSVLISLPWLGSVAQLVILVIGFGALILERKNSQAGLQLRPVQA